MRRVLPPMRHLDRDRAEMLVALAESILGPVEPEVVASGFLEAADDLVGRLLPRDRMQIRVLLTFLRVSPLLWFARRNFTGLDQRGRGRHLARLAGSRIGLFRRAFNVAKTIVTYCYWGRAASWSGIGYDGPWIGRVAVEKYADPELLREPR